jgi:hypothetical protein
MPFPLIIPEQLRTCLMAKEDVEAAVRKVFQEIQDKVEAQNNRRKVYLSEAMERLNVKSRSTMWHWHEKGYLLQDHDTNGHVFYPEYKIRRAERGEHRRKRKQSAKNLQECRALHQLVPSVVVFSPSRRCLY